MISPSTIINNPSRILRILIYVFLTQCWSVITLICFSNYRKDILSNTIQALLLPFKLYVDITIPSELGGNHLCF